MMRSMPIESPLDKVLWLLEHRARISMKDMLDHLATLHDELGLDGHELAHRGHYRKAFHAARRSPRSLQGGIDGALGFYLVALYADQLLEPGDAAAYFATAYRELYGLIHQRGERYGREWVQFPDFVHEDSFYHAINRLTPYDFQQKASRFYSRPYLLPGHMWSWINHDLLEPPQMPQKWPGRVFRSFLPVRYRLRSR